MGRNAEIVSAIDAITKEALLSKIPVIANDPLLVDQGLLLGLGCNYFNSGKQLGFMIADKIEGKKLEQNIVPPSTKQLRVNNAVATALGVVIPESLQVEITP